MLDSLLRFFATGPDRPPLALDGAALRRTYERRRWSVFLSVTFGYALFYVCRVNFGVLKKPLLDAGALSATEMGLVGTSMLFVYAIGKFLNGFLCDRANIRRFMSAALLASALANLALGATGSFFAFAVLWGLNGWFQSIGSAPSVVALSQWFSVRERGTRYGIWSCSHGIGEALTFAVTAAVVSAFGWRWGFFGPGLLGLAAGLVLTRTLADRPQTLGLPSVHVYKGDVPPKAGDGSGVGAQQLQVLKMPAVWILGMSSALMYVARYGMDHWGVLFLQEAKGFTLPEAGALLAASPLAQIVGSILAGWVSDRFFGSRRNLPALLAAVVQIGALGLLWALPPGNKPLHAATIFVFGISIGHLIVYLGGLMAVDLVPTRATGATMGLVGMFSYFGAAIQDTVSGWLLDANKTVVAGADVYSFDQVFLFWAGASALSMLLVLSLWRSSRPAEERAKPAVEAAAG